MMSCKRLIPITCFALCMGFVMLGVADDDRISNESINELQSKKEALLEEIVSRYEFGNLSGKPLLEELLAAKFDLLRAKLSVAESQADRNRLQELIVENRGALVEARIATHKLGNIAEVAILETRVGYIDAKMAFHRERSMVRATQ